MAKYRLFSPRMSLVFLLLTFAFTSMAEGGKVHKIVLHVDDNDANKMNLVLNNASNINKYYQEHGEDALIEIVAYGPGLHMFRADTSPVKKRLKSISQSYDNVSFKACNNTHKNMSRKEKKDIPLVPMAKKVPSGIIYLIQQQEKGWTYIKP